MSIFENPKKLWEKKMKSSTTYEGKFSDAVFRKNEKLPSLCSTSFFK